MYKSQNKLFHKDLLNDVAKIIRTEYKKKYVKIKNLAWQNLITNSSV